MRKKEIVAMILAGGQGTRLGVLTKNLAKPAVPFGGKYRIIDFPLSNCSNSGIHTVGVLTQYKPLKLNKHIGEGTAWDLNNRESGVSILPPYQDGKTDNFYKGTANAIYQNIDYIDSYDPEDVLILSGDHIYKMDYSKMLKFHKDKECEATLAVMEVPLNEASRFGIMNTRDDLSIYQFEEKPKVPKSNLASMGIYIFKWSALRKYLIEDENNKYSQNDFGKNIIPKMIEDKVRVCAYPFKGYWKDVGTIDSLWEANMDLLRDDNRLNLYDKEWPIYTNYSVSPIQYIGPKATVSNSIIVDGCSINGCISNSVICQGVKIGKNTIIKNSVIMPNSIIEDNVVIDKAIIDSEAVVKKNSVIGDGIEVCVVGKKESILSNSCHEEIFSSI